MLYFFSNFALVMEKILRVQSVNDYARYIGAPVLHPLVSVIHYDELAITGSVLLIIHYGISQDNISTVI